VQTGLILKARVRELSDDLVRLTTELELSALNGFVESAPRTTNETLNFVADLRSGGTYLVGAVNHTEKKRLRPTFLSLKVGGTNQVRYVQVWARAYRISLENEASKEVTSHDDRESDVKPPAPKSQANENSRPRPVAPVPAAISVKPPVKTKVGRDSEGLPVQGVKGMGTEGSPSGTGKPAPPPTPAPKVIPDVSLGEPTAVPPASGQ